MDTVMLIDGDIIAYRCSAISEKRAVIVKHKSGATKEFKNRREFKKDLEERGKSDRLHEYEFEDIQTEINFELCKKTIDSVITQITNVTFVDKKELYLSAKDSNFRLNLPLPNQYKSNRVDAIRPLLLKDAKTYIYDKYSALVSKNIEADDLLNIRGYEELAKGNKAIIASNDKDTLQSEGLYFYDFTKENAEPILIPEIGELQLVKNDVKGSGLRFFAYQLLVGDPADFYFPNDVSGIRYGKKSALADLQHLMFQDEILELVIKKYKEWYPEPVTYTAWDGKEYTKDWQGMLDMYFKCAYMKRRWNDPSDWKEFFRFKGVNLEKFDVE